MKKKDSFRIGVKYGVLVRILKRVATREEKNKRKVIYSDLKHAGEELLDYLTACTPETLDEFIDNINTWLELEAKMTGYKVTKFTTGEGKNIFQKIAIERELFYRNNKK